MGGGHGWMAGCLLDGIVNKYFYTLEFERKANDWEMVWRQKKGVLIVNWKHHHFASAATTKRRQPLMAQQFEGIYVIARFRPRVGRWTGRGCIRGLHAYVECTVLKYLADRPIPDDQLVLLWRFLGSSGEIVIKFHFTWNGVFRYVYVVRMRDRAEQTHGSVCITLALWWTFNCWQRRNCERYAKSEFELILAEETTKKRNRFG